MSLENELLRQDQRTANAFTGSSYDDVLAFYEDRGLETNPFHDTRTTVIDTALEGLTQNEAGQYFNDSGQRVYVYRDSAELGDDSGGYTGRNLVMRTEAEIREAWEADEGMGYFKEANPQLSFDDYMGFISEKDDMYASGVFDINPGDDLYNIGHKGRGPNADAINAVLAEEKANVQAAEAEANASLNDKYGIQTTFQNDDGDTFKFNGATYTKTDKIDDHLGVGDYVKMGASVLMSVYAAPLLAGSLGAVMGPVAAKAAAAAIVSQASAFMNGQDLSLGDALQSAAMAYGGAKLGDLFASGGELSGTVSEITDKVTSATDKFNELITTGNSIADAAIKAGGMSMLTSLVTTGEIDIESAGLAALMAGGADALGKLGTSLADAGATQEEVDDYMSDLTESEEFTQAAIDADIKDPFLNPNYTTVGDGLMTNAAGEVFNYAGDSFGFMVDLDLDKDGALSGNDLQNITTNNTMVPATIDDYGYEMGKPVYVDANGNPVDPGMVKRSGDGFTYNGEPVEAVTYDQAYGGDRGGLVWSDEGNAYFQMDGSEYGGSVSYDVDGNPIGENGEYLTFVPQGDIRYENGDLAYKKIDGQWTDVDGNIIDDPVMVDELGMIAAKAIDDPLNSIQYYDQDGNQIDFKYAPHDLRDSYDSGQYSGTIFGRDGRRYEWDATTGLYKHTPSNDSVYATETVWYDPTTGTEYTKDGSKVTITKVDPENIVDPSKDASDSSASGDPNDSTQSGLGDGGGTDKTPGGSGPSGVAGGGGEEGGGTEGGPGGGVVDPNDLLNNPLFPPVTPGTSGDSTGDIGGDDNGTGDNTGDSTGGTKDSDGSGDGDGAGTGGDGGGDGTGDGDDDGDSSGDGTGTGGDGGGDGTDGDGDGTGDGDGDGDGTGDGAGTGGGTGGGAGDNTGGGTSDTQGPLFGEAPGPGGSGQGGGGFGDGDGGMMSGGGSGHTPSWGELFAYTTIDGYKAKQLAPYRDAIIEARGMLS